MEADPKVVAGIERSRWPAFTVATLGVLALLGAGAFLALMSKYNTDG